MAEAAPQTRSVDLAGLATFARALVATVRAQPGLEPLAVLRAGVRAHCPQCQFRLFGEDVLALAAHEAPAPETSPKLHRLAQGFCARQGCDSRFYEFSFEAVEGVDWGGLLADLGVTGTPEAVAGEARAAADVATARRRRQRRLLLGVAVIGLLLLVRHLMTGGTIPWIREPRRFTADPATLPTLGRTNTEPPAAWSDTNRPRTFRAAPPAGPR